MDKESKNVLIWIVIGVVLTVFIWILVAKKVETNKVKNGYLTLKNKTYTVTLYDALDVPEKKEK